MTVLTLIMIGWFLAYVAVVYSRFGLLSSISASSYRWEGPTRYIMFTGWLAGLGIMSAVQSQIDPAMAVYFGLMAMGFAFAGVTVDHKSNPDSGEDEYHTAGTIMAIAAGFLGLMEAHSIYLPAAAFVIASVILRLKSRHWIWWVECSAMGFMAIGLLMR